MVEQIAAGVQSVGIRIDHMPVGTILQRPEINSLLRSSRMVGGKEQKMLAIGQERWPAVRGVLLPFKLGGACRSSAGRADAPQGIAIVGRVEDHVVPVPRATARIGRVR